MPRNCQKNFTVSVSFDQLHVNFSLSIIKGQIIPDAILPVRKGFFLRTSDLASKMGHLKEKINK